MLRWVDGFEHYGAIAHMTEGVGGGAAWSQVDDTWLLSSSNPATGDYHMRLPDAAHTKVMRRIWGVASQVVGSGYRFAVEDLPSSEGNVNAAAGLVLADIRDAGNLSHFIIVLGTDGSVFALRDANLSEGPTLTYGGTVLGRSDPCVAPGGYHHFEFKTKIDHSTGYLEVRVNEVTVLNLTGIDTQDTPNATAAQYRLGRVGGYSFGPGCGNFDVDDPFAWDDDASDLENTIVDFVGDKGAYWLKPISDTATSEFDITPSAPAYGVLDEVPPNATDYLSNTDGTARTIVGLAALPANVADVVAFQPLIYAKKDESGSTAFRGGLVVGADETYGPTDNPSTEYAYLRPGPKTIDPSTGVPWANDAAPKLLIERTA